MNPHGPGDVLIVSDLDGTLLRPDETISERTVDAINAYVAAGGLFTYATARSFTSAARVTRDLSLQLPVITYSGAVILSPIGVTFSKAATLPRSAVGKLIQVAQDHSDLQPIIFAMDGERDRLCWVPARPTRWVDAFLAKRQNDPRLAPLSDWHELDQASAFYVSLISDGHLLGHLTRLHDELIATEPDCHVILTEDIYRPGEWWLEVTSKVGTKAAAIMAVQQQSGGKPLVCIGDNQNDLPMFAVAELALAVANAAPDIQAAAHGVIPSNLNDGVAAWLERNWIRQSG